MNELPLVSVILPTRNRARTLERAIRSVLEQTYKNFELLVVDDASTDNTGDIVSSLKDPRMHYIRMGKSRGGATARNIGIAAAKGTLLAFQDSDDTWHPDKLSAQVKALTEASGRAGVCVCSSSYSVSGRVRTTLHGDGEIEGTEAVRRIVDGAGYATPTLLVKREVVDTAGGFDESLPRLQDYEFTLRAAGTCNFVLMPNALVHHTIEQDSVSASAANYVRALEIVVDKHANLFRPRRAGFSRLVFRAGKYLAEEGRSRAALPYFARALRIYPLNFRALAAIALVLTGLYGPVARLRNRNR